MQEEFVNRSGDSIDSLVSPKPAAALAEHVDDRTRAAGVHNVLDVSRLTVRFGGITALNDVHLSVGTDEIVGLIGPNGAGKSSLINCVSGFYRPSTGRINFGGEQINGLSTHAIARRGIVRTFQGTQLFSRLSVIETLLVARDFRFNYSVAEAFAWFGRPRAQESVQRDAVEEIIEFLEIEPHRHAMIGVLPYGIRKRVDLGRALAMEPKLLMLDEPMAGMNQEEKEDLARFIIDVRETRRTSMVLIEHDMGVVMELADRVAVLNFGKIIANGTPRAIQTDAAVIEAYLGIPQ